VHRIHNLPFDVHFGRESIGPALVMVALAIGVCWVVVTAIKASGDRR
jgi:hypothetical protein